MPLWEIQRRAGREFVLFASLFRVVGQIEQMCPDRGDPMLATQSRLGDIQRLQPDLRSVDHGHRNDPVQRHHRARCRRQQDVVKTEDLRPVRVGGAARLVVDRGDGGLHLVRAVRSR